MAAPTMNRTDEEIQRDILDELTWDARVQPNEIGVAVKDGVVTLTGWVDSFVKKWAAEDAAKRVRGVVAVANDIEVRLPTSAERTDEEIAKAALWTLQWDAAVPSDHLEVTVSKGWVTLRGEVDWEFQREDAERAVRRLSGVRGVFNLITVRPRSSLSPEVIKQKVEEALARSADIDPERITVEVQDGKVILRGTVHSWAAKREAEQAAWSAPGVTSVASLIKVALWERVRSALGAR